MVSQKEALMTLWKDTFDVTEYQEVKKPNGATGFQEIAVIVNQPCKLSYSTLKTTDQNDEDANVVQTTKLFCDPEIIINSGSKITVRHNGRTLDFKQSGEAGIFTNHQEIVLVPFKEYA
jgi:hypothetical protein